MVLRARRYWLAGGMAFLSAAAMAGSETADIEQLRRQSAAWDEAIVRKDRAAIEANMAADFRQIDADADLETKASFVDGLMSPKLVIAPYQVEDFEIRLYGDTALLSGRTRMQGSYDGKPFSTHYRYIDVYVRREGRWQIVSVQLTRVSQR
ncbi:nuclear transport factor 2 family protein [Paucibacter sp. APW11]|uniref:Nuclear transport factor 2 family protein n=1 Tax=Roseateles aquae TaxID=3077235 RepID=A0ABU3PH29_9BURK|nr:nuclear transport factor 2 family protein [Paucibacter sp. APW11]MDT9001868.1 nuclear transport factor 2 family protein [Paucibacter sp. APW11]